MYNVSKEFIEAIQDNTRHFYYQGEIKTKNGSEIKFDNKDIVKGSAYITNQCCGENEIELGGVYAAEIGITLYLDVDRYSLDGATIALDFYLEVGADKFEKVPLGIFEITEANRTINCLSIKGYDYMLRFDKNFRNVLTTGFAYDFLSLASKLCKVELAQSEEEIKALKNANIVISIYKENDIETWRDVLYFVAQTLGCFCTITRDGKLELRKFMYNPVINIDASHRFSSSFSDFITRYTAVSSTNKLIDKAEYYALDKDDGLTMNLGINPLFQFGLVETRKEMLKNILDDISKINFVPFDSVTIGNPALDLGDCITFSGGHADRDKITCITKYDYKINGKHTIKCVGKNPIIAKAKSKNEKNLVGLLNSVEAEKINVHRNVNVVPFNITSNETEIASIEFSSSEETDAQFNGSILIDVTTDTIDEIQKIVIDEKEVEIKLSKEEKSVITVKYILNDEEITTYMPIETYLSGKHILNLYYPLNNLKSNTYNTFTVILTVDKGSVFIDRGQSLCTISGQGLAAEDRWDGRIKIDDTFEVINKLTGPQVKPTIDEFTIEKIPQNELPQITEKFNAPIIRGFSFIGNENNIDDNLDVLTQENDISSE